MSGWRMKASDFRKSGIVQGRGGRYCLPDPDLVKPKTKPRETSENKPVPGKFNNMTGWWTDGNRCFYMKSLMESNYAHLLNFMIKLGVITAWDYEPDVKSFNQFTKKKLKNYTPDFKVFYPDGSWEYHETKGMVTKDWKRKASKMAKYYPQEKLVLIRYEQLNQLKAKFGKVPGWENPLLKEKPNLKAA